MSELPPTKLARSPLLSVPAFWPMAMAAALAEEGLERYAKNLRFVEEEIKIHGELRPKLATPNVVRLDLRTMALRDYGSPGGRRQSSMRPMPDIPRRSPTITRVKAGSRLCSRTASGMSR